MQQAPAPGRNGAAEYESHTDMLTVLLFAAAVAGVLWASRPEGGYIDYIKRCPLWHSDDDRL